MAQWNFGIEYEQPVERPIGEPTWNTLPSQDSPFRTTLPFVERVGQTLLTSGELISPNFKTGVMGWMIDEYGNVEFNDGNFRGDITGASGTFTGSVTATSGTIGGFDIGSDYLRDTANSMGMASTVTGGDDVRFWAGDTYANRATADFRVTEAGAVTASNITITGGTIDTSTLSGLVGLSNTNVAAQGWTQTSAFSVTDLDTVAWGAGTLTTAGGTSYSIGAGNTGNMSTRTYIYLDIAISTTAYQTTTTATTAVGAGKVLVATAINGAVEPTFEVFSGVGGLNINGSSIVAASITGSEIAANTIAANNITANTITASELATTITYAGSIIIDTAGLIRSGQTAYDTGTGWWIGNDGGTPKLSIGDSTGNKLTWDGVDLSAGSYFNVGAGSVTDSPYHNFVIPWQNPADTTTDYWTNGGTIVTTFGHYAAVLAPVANGTTETQLHSLFFATTFAKNIIVKFHCVFGTNGTPTSNGTEGCFIGLSDVNTTIHDMAIDNVVTAEGLGLYVDNSDGKIYARSVNNGTETDTEITGVTITNVNTYRIEFIAGSQARFHVNGVLKATITTNLPNSSVQTIFGVGVKNATNTYYVNKVTAPEFSIEK